MDDFDRLSCPKKVSERAADPSDGESERKSLTSHFHTNALFPLSFLPSFLPCNARGEWATCRF